MNGRDWLPRFLAASAIAALALPIAARAEERHFTSEPIDSAGNYKIIYAPILLTKLGAKGGAELPGTLARWTDLALAGSGKELPEGTNSGPYRILSFEELRNPSDPTQPPHLRVVIEQEGTLSEETAPPSVSLVDSSTGLETTETAAVLRERDRTLYRVELTPPKAALVPEGHRVYLNPADRYAVELLGGVAERVAGMRQTLPTFGGHDHRRWDTNPSRRPSP